MSTNPQAAQMGDESMARNLAFQARAIWPAEQRLFERYALEGRFRALDVGCGTGEITLRLAQRYPEADPPGEPGDRGGSAAGVTRAGRSRVFPRGRCIRTRASGR